MTLCKRKDEYHKQEHQQNSKARGVVNMDYAGSPSRSLNTPNEAQMMNQVKAELQTAYAQEFYNVRKTYLVVMNFDGILLYTKTRHV